MLKYNNKGFVLAETLIVTVFVAGVLIYLFIQFSNLSSLYNESYSYNTVESLYALEDVVDFIKSDALALSSIKENVKDEQYIDISNCNIFISQEYCEKLFELENIDTILVTMDNIPNGAITSYDSGFLDFISSISRTDNNQYRLIASFNNSTYATLRFGE